MPTTGPTSVPTPPSSIAMNRLSELSSAANAGFTKPLSDANRAPASPASAELIVKLSSLVRNGGVPRAAAASSPSRSATNARPKLEPTTFRVRSRTAATNAQIC